MPAFPWLADQDLEAVIDYVIYLSQRGEVENYVTVMADEYLEVTKGLCGDHRPGHFDGVATVVTKLFAQCEPDAAWFGEKDYQQLTVIRRLARDLGLPVAVHGVATVREPDGLALSSRNAYLDARERAIAPVLHRSLTALAEAVLGGAAPAAETARARAALLDAGFASVDYVELRDARTLAPVDTLANPARALAAAQLGRARLIDNVAVEPGTEQE